MKRLLSKFKYTLNRMQKVEKEIMLEFLLRFENTWDASTLRKVFSKDFKIKTIPCG